MTISITGIIAFNGVNEIDSSLNLNVEALARDEGTSYDGALWSNSAGTLYCCGPGNVRDCDEINIPDCGF